MEGNQISKQALARKKRFVEAKEKAGGAEALSKSTPIYRVYFDDEGNITCFTAEDIKPNPNWETYDFDQDQLKILVGKEKTINKYRVKKDPNVDNLYSIELRPIENNVIDTNADFLFNVEFSDTKICDIKIKLTEKHIRVFMNPEIKKEYADVYPINATRNGVRLCKFYITANDDTHVLFYYTTISLAELLTDDYAQRQLPSVL